MARRARSWSRWPAAALALAAAVGVPARPARAAAHPNVVILLADDLGFADVGYRGSPIATPAIDRLAREGVRLERFYATPICSPTRAALLSGRDPLKLGMAYDQLHPWYNAGLAPDAYLLPDAFRAAGYQTGLVGKWHLGHAQAHQLPNAHGLPGIIHTAALDPPWKLVQVLREEPTDLVVRRWLFRIEEDPNEERDLASAHPGEAARLAEAIAAWRSLHPMAGTRGTLVPPPGWVPASDWAAAVQPASVLQTRWTNELPFGKQLLDLTARRGVLVDPATRERLLAEERERAAAWEQE
jgi:hypothetical protein